MLSLPASGQNEEGCHHRGYIDLASILPIGFLLKFHADAMREGVLIV